MFVFRRYLFPAFLLGVLWTTAGCYPSISSHVLKKKHPGLHHAIPDTYQLNGYRLSWIELYRGNDLEFPNPPVGRAVFTKHRILRVLRLHWAAGQPDQPDMQLSIFETLAPRYGFSFFSIVRAAGRYRADGITEMPDASICWRLGRLVLLLKPLAIKRPTDHVRNTLIRTAKAINKRLMSERSARLLGADPPPAIMLPMVGRVPGSEKFYLDMTAGKKTIYNIAECQLGAKDRKSRLLLALPPGPKSAKRVEDVFTGLANSSGGKQVAPLFANDDPPVFFNLKDRVNMVFRLPAAQETNGPPLYGLVLNAPDNNTALAMYHGVKRLWLASPETDIPRDNMESYIPDLPVKRRERRD